MVIVEIGTGFFPVHPDGIGGVEKYIHYLSEELSHQGHDVTVIDLPASSRPPTSYRVEEVPLRWRFDNSLPAHAIRGLIFGLEAAKRLRTLTKQGKVDLINFHSQFTGIMGIPVARRNAVATVFTNHNPLWSDSRACQSRFGRLKFGLERAAESLADAILSVSQTVAANKIRFFGVPSNKVSAIPCGVHDTYFRRAETSLAVKARFSPDSKPIILQVARIAPYKNQLSTARAFKAVLQAEKDVRLIFAGSTDNRRYFKAVKTVFDARALQVSVDFAGPIIKELRQLYGLATIVVLPSLQENSPLAVLESMAQGKAIIASNIPPIQELLPEGTAILVPPLDCDALASAMLRLLHDDQLREELGNNARQRAHNVYRWETVAEGVAAMYHTVINTNTESQL